MASPSSTTVLTSASSPTSTTQNQYDDGTLHTLTTVMPAFLIAFICVISIFLACGIFHGRRRRLMLLRHVPSARTPMSPDRATAPSRSRKKKRLIRPKLWEVDMKEVAWNADLVSLEPVAVELQAVPRSALCFSHHVKRGSSWYIPSLSRGHRPEEYDDEETDPPPRRAQVTVLLSMPTPERAVGLPTSDYAIGTTWLPFKEPLEPDSEDEERQLRDIRNVF